MNKTEAIFISTQGDYLEAIIEVLDMRLYVMDEFGGSSIPSGQRIEIELSPFISNSPEHNEWEIIFSSNPEKKIELVHQESWSYLALGKIISINPVICDCGIIQVKEPLYTHDTKCIGEYVAFKIDRLSAYLASSTK